MAAKIREVQLEQEDWEPQLLKSLFQRTRIFFSRNPIAKILQLSASIPLLIFALLFWTGCTSNQQEFANAELQSPTAWEHSETDADSARSILALATPALVDSAYQALDTVPHERTIQTRQMTPRKHTIALSTRRLAISSDGSTEVLSRHDEGSFDFGWMGTFARNDREQKDLDTPPRDIIPDDPGYLATRNFEDYSYRLLMDTSWNGISSYGAEVQLRDDADNNPIVNAARAVFARADNRLLYYSALHIRETPLFSERTYSEWTSTFQTDTPTAILPASTRVITWLKMPFTDPREISNQSEFTYRDTSETQ